MAVEVPADIQARCKGLGKGVGYALKVLCAQLEDDPLLGSPTGDRSLYIAQIDGETFEDCPALTVHYAYGPPLLEEGQLQIRGIEETHPAAVEPKEEAVAAPDPHQEEIEARQVTDSWRRIEAWLCEHASASFDLLKPGASEGEIAALEEAIGVRVPASLKALWQLRAGHLDEPGAGFLPEYNWALMDLDAVVLVYRERMELQRDWGSDEPFLWKPSWIPFCAWSTHDFTSGLYLDAESGEVCRWSESIDRRTEFESLTAFLEGMADALEVPSLATWPKPGLLNGGLVWGPPGDANEEALWRPWNG
ncbi:SMI1/KNR4 family protein [Streptomyces sp. NBC_00885]|uniref:SMI1/KNR4 family protein n=1 Tax=Streptomyces sp. NBC_00885 TaxID=2975857 RepID=UPI003870ADFA|nr:SMI1/KNR4 family protein [Streptomyces sp. NBC_00885]